jgi:hypothetical protein
MKTVRHILNFSMTCGDHRTVNINEDQGDAPADPESQDEDDMGYGTHPGGGFTSIVTGHLVTMHVE